MLHSPMSMYIYGILSLFGNIFTAIFCINPMSTKCGTTLNMYYMSVLYISIKPTLFIIFMLIWWFNILANSNKLSESTFMCKVSQTVHQDLKKSTRTFIFACVSERPRKSTTAKLFFTRVLGNGRFSNGSLHSGIPGKRAAVELREFLTTQQLLEAVLEPVPHECVKDWVGSTVYVHEEICVEVQQILISVTERYIFKGRRTQTNVIKSKSHSKSYSKHADKKMYFTFFI